MADNLLYIPELNPVLFFDSARANLPVFFTKHFEKWMFKERLLDWQYPYHYCQVWQTTDIINLQFTSTFDPIVVKLLDADDNVIITLPALIGLPNKFIPGAFSFQVNMSLAGLDTGCYRLMIEAGSGPNKKTLYSGCQYISSEQIRNTVLLEYWNSRFHKDVIFETGIKFQLRVHAHFGFLEKSRRDEAYRDERYNPTLLNSRSAKQWPIFFGNEYGLPDDMINMLDEAWSCDNVIVDGKAFGIADGSKMELPEIDSHYPKRGMKLMVEEGINRNSRIFSVDTDTNKKLVTSIIVEAKVFGDTSNQGSSNTVPVYNIE